MKILKTGIYKIISPSNKIYIGQAVNIEKRFNDYQYPSRVKTQRKLYRSLLKYGIENHIFEIIEECSIDQLNNREFYWQIYYDVVKKGLNCMYVKTDTLKSKFSEETKKLMSINNARYWKNKKLHPNTLNAIIKANTGRKHSEEEKQMRNSKLKGLKRSPESLINMRNANLGKKMSKESIIKMKNKKKKIILDLQIGIYYNGIEEAAKAYNINKSTLSNRLNGQNINKTNLIYV